MADHVAAALRFTEDGYSISDEVMAELNEQNVWALLINNDTRQVVWQTEHLPDNIPMQYTLSDIAELTRGYIDGYPTFTGKENSKNLSEIEHKKAAAIVKQSNRMKDLISDLNLASKLEYDMQPLTMKQENAISIVRQVVVDFMNMNIDDSFPIEWKTVDTLSACYIDADQDLLKRAIANLIQNSINHNENGCVIYVSVEEDDNICKICVEDNGTGASDEQIDRLNNTPHYMVCDTNTAEQRHGLGLLIVKQIMEGHSGEMIIGHSGYGGFKVVLMIPE